jgi:hypothetical protein
MAINSKMDPAMESIQKGVRCIRRIAREKVRSKHFKQSPSKDLSRVIVEMKHPVHRAKTCCKLLRAAAKLLGTRFDEKA